MVRVYEAWVGAGASFGRPCTKKKNGKKHENGEVLGGPRLRLRGRAERLGNPRPERSPPHVNRIFV